jgi:Spy/CpxP family protein refolding chaperone
MGRTITAVFAALAIMAAGSAAMAPSAMAQSAVVQVNPGGIAFGYTDGYWDQSHQWHAWRDQKEAQAWREEHRDHYYAYKHDRDRDQGWRANDTWWHH